MRCLVYDTPSMSKYEQLMSDMNNINNADKSLSKDEICRL